MEFYHKSVLLKESVDFLCTNRDGIYVDCTLGGGGHSCALAETLSDKAVLVGIDQDADACRVAETRILNRYRCKIKVVQDNFQNLSVVLKNERIGAIDGIFFDLGVSSYQLDNADRGFSYMQDGPLDMRMDQNQKVTASKVVNSYSEEHLAEVIWKYGEERWAKRIAAFVVSRRKEKLIATTGELVKIIKMAIPAGARQNGPHPAKRTFQALRIEVNDELGILDSTIRQSIERLRSGGRIGVITFHSLEDRIIKRIFAQMQKGCTCPPNLPCVCEEKPKIARAGSIKPSQDEISQNPRARSARLRWAIKI